MTGVGDTKDATAPTRPHDPLEAATVVDSGAARQARAKWLVQGAILQMTPEIALTSQLIDVADGSLIATYSVGGEAGVDIFAIVDQLTPAVKHGLSLPEGARNE